MVQKPATRPARLTLEGGADRLLPRWPRRHSEHVTSNGSLGGSSLRPQPLGSLGSGVPLQVEADLCVRGEVATEAVGGQLGITLLERCADPVVAQPVIEADGAVHSCRKKTNGALPKRLPSDGTLTVRC